MWNGRCDGVVWVEKVGEGMKKVIIFVVAAVVCWQVGAAVGWKNLNKENHLGGRVTSEGDMRGKVTLVCRWGLKFQKCRTMLPKIEDAFADIKWALADL